MDADLSRLPTGTSGWVALADYVLALGDLSEVDFLELKGTLAFSDGPARKRSAVVLGRAVVGMGNRMPDVASRNLGGFGVVLVGIEGQRVVSAEEIDGADLRPALEAYIGEDGPRWDHQYFNHPNGLILAVVVDPPQWGDKIHTIRKSYSDHETKLAVRDGGILVRLPGLTRPATSHDVAQLELRRSKAPHTDAKVKVGYVGQFDRVSTTNVTELVGSLVASQADTLYGTLTRRPTQSTIGSGLAAFYAEQQASTLDERTPDAFRAEVDAWQDECRVQAEDAATEFLRHTLDKGTFFIENQSDRYLENVQVQVRFPLTVGVAMASDTDYCDHGGSFQFQQVLPKPPAKYGSLRPNAIDAVLPRNTKGFVPNVRPLNFTVEHTGDEVEMTWTVGNLPPRARIKADESFVVYADEEVHDHEHCTPEDHPAMSEHLVAGWSVTARGVDHVFVGEMELDCRQNAHQILIWSRTKHV